MYQIYLKPLSQQCLATSCFVYRYIFVSLLGFISYTTTLRCFSLDLIVVFHAETALSAKLGFVAFFFCFLLFLRGRLLLNMQYADRDIN